ncbi:MAG: RNA methyltransferase [Candidatus Babeliales bacterium]
MKFVSAIPANQELKTVARLKDAHERYQRKQFVAEGLRTCQAIIEAGVEPKLLFVTDKMLEKVPQDINREVVRLIKEDDLKKISHSTTPSGMLGVFPMPSAPEPAQLTSGIVLVGISDPGNMGTLIRTCVALGKKSIVLIDGADVFNSKVVQASAGAIAQAQLFKLSWQELVQYKKDLPLIGLVVENGEPLHKLGAMPDSLLVIGSEAHGIPGNYIRDCQKKVTIAMPGNAESLNAAIAGSIAMYTLWSATGK